MLEKGVDAANFPFFDKDIRNFIQSQSAIGKEFDASNDLKLCKSLEDADNAFEHEFQSMTITNWSILFENLVIQIEHMKLSEIWLFFIPLIE